MAQINDYDLLARRFCPLLVYLALAGCDKTVAWQEEVQLSTGETIMIDREVVLKPGSGLPPAVGPYVNEYHIRFRYPPRTGLVIEWDLPRFKFLKNREYQENPVVLDLSQDKVWFIYTTRTDGDGCIRYVKYQFQEGKWIEIPLPDGLIDVHQANLSLKTDIAHIKGGGIGSLMEKKYELESGGPYPPSYMKQVGPQQVVPYQEGFKCVWDPIYEHFNVVLINKGKQHGSNYSWCPLYRVNYFTLTPIIYIGLIILL